MNNKQEIIDISINGIMSEIVDIDKDMFAEKAKIVLNKFVDEITKTTRDELMINLLSSEFQSLFSRCATVEVNRREMATVIVKETLAFIQKKLT